MSDGPQLGLATTEELFREVIARLTINDYSAVQHQLDVDRALVLAEMLGGLCAVEREYRTVDSG